MAAAQSALVLATREQESSNELFPIVGGLGEGGLEHFVGLYQRPQFTDGNGNVARLLRNLLLGT